MAHSPFSFSDPISRRETLRRCGAGFGTLGLASLLSNTPGFGADVTAIPRFPAARISSPAPNTSSRFSPTAVRRRWTRSTRSRFSPNTTASVSRFTLATERPTSTALGSPFSFARYGQSGLEVSELFAGLAEKHADDLCVIRSMYSDTPIHENSLRLMNCGASIMARPSIGSWVTYGLGTGNQNLPGFVVLVPKGMPVAGADNWQSSFLPGAYQGTYIETQDRKASAAHRSSQQFQSHAHRAARPTRPRRCAQPPPLRSPP